MGQPALVITVRGCRAADQQIFFVILWYEMVYRSVDANRSLTAAFVKGVRHSGKPHGPDKYCDQHGLILRILPTDSKQWIWRGTIHGKRVDLGLGSWPYVSLADARQAAFEHRKLARAGGDPRTLRASLGISMFAEAVEKVIAMHEPNWKDGARSAEIWRSSLSRYAMPRLGAKRISDIETADVMAVLLPIWASKRETAKRVRQRIGTVMKWAVAQGYRPDNPAGDAIGAALPNNGAAKKHHRALPHSEVAEAIGTIRALGAYWATVAALEFLILTAARSGEVRSARWTEMDFGDGTWTVPAERMKAKREHRVPLSGLALRILSGARELTGSSDLVFPSARGLPMSDNTLSKLLREQGIDAVVHGFRSSFRNWAAECSDAPQEVCELALAHVNSDRVEAAYMRSDLFAKRRVPDAANTVKSG